MSFLLSFIQAIPINAALWNTTQNLRVGVQARPFCTLCSGFHTATAEEQLGRPAPVGLFQGVHLLVAA